MSAVENARRLLASGQSESAVAELRRGAARGDSLSWLELGMLFLAGRHVQRDLPSARYYFKRAGEAGDPTGKNIFIQLLGVGAGGEPDWNGAIAELRGLARNDDAAASQLALLDRMDLSTVGDPSGAIARRQLSTKPEVSSFDRLFSIEECAYLVRRAQPLLQPSVVVDPATGQLTPHPVRTSHNTVFPWVSEDLVIQALNRRIAAASGTAAAAGEPLQVLRYQPGQQYRPHFDAFDETDNQRVLTMLVYLNDEFEGGQTVFTHTGLTFRGGTGDGLLFRNATPTGARDKYSQHAGRPVTRGEKWLASRWIRERPLVTTQAPAGR
jgi:prolyl 4-hydroxylase